MLLVLLHCNCNTADSCFCVSVCRYGAVQVLQGRISIGDLNAFMLYAIFVGGSAGGLAGTAAQVIAAVSPLIHVIHCILAAVIV